MKTKIIMSIIFIVFMVFMEIEVIAANNKNEELRDNGWEYKGQTTVTYKEYVDLNSQYGILTNIHTGVKVLSKNDESVEMQYEFISLEDYPNLDRTKTSSSFNFATEFGSIIELIIPVVVLLVLLIKWTPAYVPNKSKNKETK